LEDISSILSTGEIDDIFEKEDIEHVVLTLGREVSRLGLSDSKRAIFRFFLQRAKKKLHLVISTSPIGQHFRQRCRSYPALINCCTIDWYDTWPLKALQSVASSFLETTDLEVVEVSDKLTLRHNLSKLFVAIHNSVEEEAKVYHEEMHRHFYITPTTYMEYVRLFVRKFQEKASDFTLNQERLTNGLQKLGECNELVKNMKEELVHLGPQLEQKSKVSIEFHSLHHATCREWSPRCALILKSRPRQNLFSSAIS